LTEPPYRCLAELLGDLYNMPMKNKVLKLNCETCGGSFHPEYGREKTSRYCSKSCYHEGRWGKTPPNSCLTCGKDISDTGDRSQKFCSVKCTGEWRSQNIRGENHPTYQGAIAYGRDNRYRARRSPDHPFADSKGYVMEHRLVVEDALGRILDPGEVVHHINEEPADNRIENLEVMTTAEHDRLHSQKRKGVPRPKRR
jgi:hypothetical protein